MVPRLRRRDRIVRIEVRIARLGQHAGELLEAEQELERRLRELREATDRPAGRLRRARIARSERHAERRLRSVRDEREALVEDELGWIMRSLQQQSQRTRMRLDRELGRLEPVQAEWEQMRRTFGTLEQVVASAAIQQLAGQLSGELGIPEFPVREHDGYERPFPHGALVF
jgi:hypothetical protein